MGYIVSLVWMAESPPRRMGVMLQSILRPTLSRKEFGSAGGVVIAARNRCSLGGAAVWPWLGVFILDTAQESQSH